MTQWHQQEASPILCILAIGLFISMVTVWAVIIGTSWEVMQ